MEIRNAGNRIMNTWLYPIEDGWVMIDTGYENSYASVLKKLQKMRITPEDAMAADEIFTLLMGDKVEPRREFIEQNATLVKDLDL